VGVAKPFRIAVLASGSGTNLQAILDTLHGRDGIEVVGVGSNKPGARALDRAADAGIPAEIFPASGHESRKARDDAIADWLDGLAVDLVVLAGYMELLSAAFIERFQDRVINVHPALLPSFPGLDAVGQALDAGVETTGVTIHFVDAGVDTGPIILQRPVPVPPDRDRDALEAAIHATEHELYPEAIRMISEGRVLVDGAIVRISEGE
jgi:phosphoribosylglycinamide formyltransferase-1